MKPKMLTADAANFIGTTILNVHHRLKSRGLDHKKSANRTYFEHGAAVGFFDLSLPSPAIVTAVTVVKGGPGKTSVVKNLATRLSLYGARVLLVDLDQQGNLTSDFIDNADDLPIMIDVIRGEASFQDALVSVLPGVDLVPSRLENSTLDKLLMVGQHPLDRVFRELIDSVKGAYNFVFLDCPPALSQTVTAAILAADNVIIPVAPEKYCLSGLKMSYSEIKEIEKKFKRSVDVKILINKFDARTSLSRGILEQLAASPTFSGRMFSSLVRVSQDIPNSSFNRVTIFDAYRPSTASEDFDILASEILAPYKPKTKASQALDSTPLGTLSDKNGV